MTTMQRRIKIQSWLCVLVKKSAPDDAKIPRHFWDLIDHISSRITEKKYGGKKRDLDHAQAYVLCDF